MNPSLWFVVPVHGRMRLTAICLRQLAITRDQLRDNDIDAHVVVIADALNLRELRARLGHHGFATVERANNFLSQKYNDGIQLAMDERYNPRPADFVVPCGSDDWVDWRIFTELPSRHAVLGFQHISFVREDGREMTAKFLDYPGGCGIRVYPRQLMFNLGFRPADEDRVRACDTSILHNVQKANRIVDVRHRDVDPWQIVDWKSRGTQMNPYDALRRHRSTRSADPFLALAGRYPDESLEAMAGHYGRTVARPRVLA